MLAPQRYQQPSLTARARMSSLVDRPRGKPLGGEIGPSNSLILASMLAEGAGRSVATPRKLQGSALSHASPWLAATPLDGRQMAAEGHTGGRFRNKRLCRLPGGRRPTASRQGGLPSSNCRLSGGERARALGARARKHKAGGFSTLNVPRIPTNYSKGWLIAGIAR